MIASDRRSLVSNAIYSDGVRPIGLAALVTACLLLSIHADPILVAKVLWTSTFGSLRTFGEGLVRAAPLLMVSATLLPSLRAKIYNIGAPGQIGAGALATTVIALAVPQSPSVLLISVCGIAAAIAGAAVAFVPGYLKARWNVSEIVSSLAMNFVTVSVLSYLLSGPLQSDFANLPQSPALPPSSTLPLLFSGTRAHIGLIVSLIVVILLSILATSVMGYRLRMFSSNATLAARSGVNANRYLISLMMLGGAGAGLAGWMQVAAIDHRLYPGVADPIGYAGLFVALLGGLNPFGIVVSSFLMGALLYGAGALQIGASISPEITQVFLGVVLFTYAARPTAIQ
ncbi:ABC transporter permease [Bradyrhizobium canariense]|uniref:Nucleoside ABC transporter membrane protein n=1 Tax=Bradyrhizobium canariense TaxID=255045 RepID=A0A1H1YRT6_9BRAD|nr:ABC transporter permease [Bradyrhizobium canariense]SDT23816.1 nucleoside ABC transporter membrane protein [Bradyrhizobium canariense]